jgi:hypothetical protein
MSKQEDGITLYLGDRPVDDWTADVARVVREFREKLGNCDISAEVADQMAQSLNDLLLRNIFATSDAMPGYRVIGYRVNP